MEQQDAISKKSKKVDFFNLDSSEDEEDEDEVSPELEKKRQEEIEEKVKKWDWDRPENFHFYFKHGNVSDSKKAPKKRPMLEADYDSNQTKRLCQPATAYIEPLENETSSSSSNDIFLFNLIGHKSSVNRIHWGKKPEHKSILLSSSLDG